MKILILGGTGEARALANRLVEHGHDVTTSLAGRTSDPLLPTGAVRIGGFGGIEGLSAYLTVGGYEYLVDATHPYAGIMSANAVAASRATGIPLLRLLRAPWQPAEGAHWLHVADVQAAAAILPPNARVLLTTGHAGLDSFLQRENCTFWVRVIEPPQQPLPAHAHLLLARPPFTLESETALLSSERITHIVSKNSGGAQTAAKLEAARRLGIAVVMIDRPHYDPAREVATVEAAFAALHEDASRR